jgi:hypothetical protein
LCSSSRRINLLSFIAMPIGTTFAPQQTAACASRRKSSAEQGLSAQPRMAMRDVAERQYPMTHTFIAIREISS